jgi:hypothetical protein
VSRPPAIGATVPEDDPPRRDDPSPVQWDLLVPVVLSLLGGATYAALRAGYVSFYNDFGTSPDDVGLGYLQVLAGSIWAIALILSFGSAVVVCVLWRLGKRREWEAWGSRLARLEQAQEQLDDDWDRYHEDEERLGSYVPTDKAEILDKLEERRQELDKQQTTLDRRRERLDAVPIGQLPRALRITLSVATACFLAAIAWITWAVPHDLGKAKARITTGQEVGPRDMAVLAIQADQATVTWVGTGRPPAELASSGLLYLGHAEGEASLYSSSVRRALRVPERHVVIVIVISP